MCVKTNSVLYSQEHVFCLVVLLTDWGFLRGNHLPFVGKISYDVCTVCVSVFCVSKGRSRLTVNWQTHTCAHAQDAPEDPNILGLVFFSSSTSLKVTCAQRGGETHTVHVNVCWKGQLGLHNVAHHPWRLLTAQPITAKDLVMQCPSYWRDS